MSEPIYYGTVYVYARCSDVELAGLLARGLDGYVVSGAKVIGGGLEVDVLTNDEYEESRAAEGAGDFLYFPLLVEVGPVDPANEPDPVASSTRLLDGLRSAGFDFVMDSDFEDELPNKGRSRDYTW